MTEPTIIDRSGFTFPNRRQEIVYRFPMRDEKSKLLVWGKLRAMVWDSTRLANYIGIVWWPTDALFVSPHAPAEEQRQ